MVNKDTLFKQPKHAAKNEMELDCSGAGVCQPEPENSQQSDIQPSMPGDKLKKIKEEEKE